MRAGAAVAQLQRMLAMKEKRIETWRGPDEAQHYLRSDIAALRFALGLIDALGLEQTRDLMQSSAVRK